MSTKPRGVKHIREALGLSQAQFSRVLGVHTQTVSKWERQILKPNTWQRGLLEVCARAAMHTNLRDPDEYSIADILTQVGPMRDLPAPMAALYELFDRAHGWGSSETPRS